MAPKGETAVVVEVPFFSEDAVDSLASADFARLVLDELSALRLLDPRDVIESREHRLLNAYPVYENGYGRNVQIVLDSLARASIAQRRGAE